MGGLGANIGSEKWEIANRKKEIARQYADNLKLINKSSKQTRTPAAPMEKEKTAREKALEFAKNNVPKPK